jgi:hypothetical protein
MNKFSSYKKWINEKFEEDSDPIRDLGIGGIVWENIKPGDIFYNNKERCVLLSKKIESSNLFILSIPFYIIDFTGPLYARRDVLRIKDKDLIHWSVRSDIHPLSYWKKKYKILQEKELKELQNRYDIRESINEKNKIL